MPTTQMRCIWSKQSSNRSSYFDWAIRTGSYLLGVGQFCNKFYLQSIQFRTYDAEKINRGMGRRTAVSPPSGEQRILNELVRLDLRLKEVCDGCRINALGFAGRNRALNYLRFARCIFDGGATVPFG